MSTVSQTLRRLAREETPAPAPIKAIPSVEEVGILSLQELGETLLILEVESDLFGETVLFTGNGVQLPSEETRVAYTARELEALHDLSPGELRLVHEFKKVFNGSWVTKSTMH